METAREKYFILNTMTCLLKALEGHKTKIELRNENEVEGQIVTVDGFMNITIAMATFTSWKGQVTKFTSFFVQGPMIRYVHIPDEINMKKAMEKVLKKYCPHTSSLRVRDEIKGAAWKKMVRKKKEHERISRLKAQHDERQNMLEEQRKKAAEDTE